MKLYPDRGFDFDDLKTGRLAPPRFLSGTSELIAPAYHFGSLLSTALALARHGHDDVEVVVAAKRTDDAGVGGTLGLQDDLLVGEDA